MLSAVLRSGARPDHPALTTAPALGTLHRTGTWHPARAVLLQWFRPASAEVVPDNSILREFIDGSILENFQWAARTR